MSIIKYGPLNWYSSSTKKNISGWFLTKKIDFERQQIPIFRVYLRWPKKSKKVFNAIFLISGTIQFNSINLALLWNTFIKFHWPCEKLTKACINENDVVIPIALIYHAAFEEDNPKVNVLVMENLKDQGYKPLRPETCGLVYMRAAMTRSDKT